MAWLTCGNGVVCVETSSDCQEVSDGGGGPCRRDEEADRKGKRKAAEPDDRLWSADEECCEDRQRTIPAASPVCSSPANSNRSRPCSSSSRCGDLPNRNINGGATSCSSFHIDILDDSSDEEEKYEDRQRETSSVSPVRTPPGATESRRTPHPPPPPRSRCISWGGAGPSSQNVNGARTSCHTSCSYIDILDDESSDEEYDETRRNISMSPVHPLPVTTTDNRRPSPHPPPRPSIQRADLTDPNTTSAGTTSSSSPCYIDRLNLDLLSAVFSKIDPGTDEVFRSAPFVCRSWRDACLVDTADFTQYRYRARNQLDVAVRSVAWRCRHQLQRLVVPNISQDVLDYVFWDIPCLKVLKISFSPVADDVFLGHTHCLGHLTDVDLSYCANITARAITVLGRSCPFLVRSIAMAIAETMSTLEDLVLENRRISTEGVRVVVENCVSLRYIDLTGCLGLRDEDFWSKMRDVTIDVVSTVGFKERPVLTNRERYYLYPIE